MVCAVIAEGEYTVCVVRGTKKKWLMSCKLGLTMYTKYDTAKCKKKNTSRAWYR